MPLVSIIVLSVCAGIAVIAGIFILLFKLMHKLLSSQKDASSDEDARLLQDLNTKLNRLEHRIESLETIVTSAERNPRS
jgi:phage shock protein B